MKAVVRDRYGPPALMSLAEVPKPVPADDEILIRIHAVSVNRSDWEGLTGKPLYARIDGLRKPRHKILGSDIAGTVEAAGKNHTTFRPGDEVFGDVMADMGGFAEYVCTRGRIMAIKPPSLPFEQAAALPQAAVIALQAIRDNARPRAGMRVLINGAGGGAGTFAVQLAKQGGAEVTGVDNGSKLDLMRSVGADHVVDHTREDFTKSGERYDFILDLAAYRSPSAYARALRSGGKCFLVGGSVGSLLRSAIVGPILRRVRDRGVGVLVVKPNPADIQAVGELAVTGSLVPVIERSYKLQDVAEAIRRVGEGRAQGKVVIRVHE